MFNIESQILKTETPNHSKWDALSVGFKDKDKIIHKSILQHQFKDFTNKENVVCINGIADIKTRGIPVTIYRSGLVKLPNDVTVREKIYLYKNYLEQKKGANY